MIDQIVDPTTAAIAASNDERDCLRAEVEASFEKGYDQAVREIRDHFAKAGDHGIVHVIETIWKISFEKERSS